MMMRMSSTILPSTSLLVWHTSEFQCQRFEVPPPSSSRLLHLHHRYIKARGTWGILPSTENVTSGETFTLLRRNGQLVPKWYVLMTRLQLNKMLNQHIVIGTPLTFFYIQEWMPDWDQGSLFCFCGREYLVLLMQNISASSEFHYVCQGNIFSYPYSLSFHKQCTIMKAHFWKSN